MSHWTSGPQIEPSKCLVCGGTSPALSKAIILYKYEVQYYRCINCGFTQTERPYWLAESYSTGMSDLDLGPINRGIECAEMTRALLLTSFNFRAPCVDYGAGYGVFVRRMRDLGFDFHAYDKYSSNIFAKGFEAAAGKGDYELLTAFEVFEHVTDPVADLKKMLDFAPNIFFSTQLLPSNNPKPGEWWYFVLGHGQHIALHTERSLAILAEKCGLKFISDGELYHLFTRKPVSRQIFLTAIHRLARIPLGCALARLRHVRSLLRKDFQSNLDRKPYSAVATAHDRTD